ncbi:MAG: cupin domain-containing protein [Propionibacteriales bacterium]|nr:cupin domain-containing protein [Propionibacteriales bacterium]
MEGSGRSVRAPAHVDAPSHYDVQRDRRRTFIERWRERRQEVIRPSDVDIATIAPGVLRGGYLGTDAGRPTRLVDCAVHRLDAGAVTAAHRHSWDAVLFVLSGTGWTEVDGHRYAWKPWDAVHLPSWAAHRHGTDDPRGAEFLSFSSEPVFETLGAAWMLAADEPSPTAGAWPRVVAGGFADARTSRLASAARAAGGGRIHTDYDEIPLRPNAKGTRSKFLVDPSIGSGTSGLTMVMTQYGPGLWQAKHRHPGEAVLYVVEGRGHSYFGEDVDGGTEYTWQAGDLLVVDHFLWHQHFNDDPERPARLLRVHLMETMLTTMQALLDPLPLLEEPPEEMAKAPDATVPDWPADRRPE